MNAKLEIDGLTKEFPSKGGATVTLSDVDLTVGEGELVTIVGASGCGKSTLLEIIAGFTEPTSGQVLLDGENDRRSRAGPWLCLSVLFSLPLA